MAANMVLPTACHSSSGGGEVARLRERAVALYGGTFLTGEAFCSVLGVSPSPDLQAMLTSVPAAPGPVRK